MLHKDTGSLIFLHRERNSLADFRELMNRLWPQGRKSYKVAQGGSFLSGRVQVHH